MKYSVCEELFESELIKVSKKLKKYVVSTYGPYGQQVLISSKNKTILTKDGVTVAKAFFGENDVQNSILNILKQCAEKTVNDAGDGTTTSILLLDQFIDNILYLLKLAQNKISRMEVYDLFKKTIVELCKNLENISIPVETKDMLKHVAFMACNGDENIANLVTELIDNVGVNGHVLIKESRNHNSSIKIMEGIKFNSAVLSTSFLPDYQDKLILNDCVVVVSNTKIQWNQEFIDLMSECVRNKKTMLCVCPDMDERLLLTLALNVEKKNMQACVLSPAYLGVEKLELFEDVACVVGTHVSTSSLLNRSKCDEWGACKVVEITRGQCTLIDGKASPEMIEAAIETYKKRLKESEDEIINNRLINRINRLTSTIGILYVGGTTPAEMIERKHRAEDALESCNSALKKGVVPGGGAALLLASQKLKKSNKIKFENNVIERIQDLCESQARELYGEKFKECFKVSDNKILVKDLRTNKYGDYVKTGIVESTWTVQCAMQNAFATAWLLCNSFGGLIDNE